MKKSDEEENELANLLKSLPVQSAPTNSALEELSRQSSIAALARGLASLQPPTNSVGRGLRSLVDSLPPPPPISALARGLASLQPPTNSVRRGLRSLIDSLPPLPPLNPLALGMSDKASENALTSLLRSAESDNKKVYKGTKRRVFISHYKGDRTEVEAFIEEFGNKQKVFTPFVLGANDNYVFFDSNRPDYVMSQIREKYLKDSTVTIVLIGSCTHSRRFVDWEIKSSLRQGKNYIPNGLIGIILPSKGTTAYLPPRLKDNWTSGHRNCYARYWTYPDSAETLGRWIEDAYNARTSRAGLIVNLQDMMKYNSKCKTCQITH